MHYEKHYRYIFRVFATLFLTPLTGKSELFLTSSHDQVPVLITMEPLETSRLSAEKMERLLKLMFETTESYPMDDPAPDAIVNFLVTQTIITASRYDWQLIKFEIPESLTRSYLMEFVPKLDDNEQDEYCSSAGDKRHSHSDGLSYDDVTPAVQKEVSQIISRMSK